MRSPAWSRQPVAIAMLSGLALGLSVPAARACASCGCGDPTLTSIGTEQPFDGRLRVAGRAVYRTDEIGEPGVDEVRLREWSFELGASYAPVWWLVAAINVPFVWRDVRYVNLGRDRSFGLGDTDALLKLAVYRDRALAPRRLLSLVGGARVPTAPVQRDREGKPIDVDAQTGTGAWAAIAGASYAEFMGQWSGYASSTGYIPTAGRDGLRPGFSLRSTLAAQYQPRTWGAARLALDGRLDGRTRLNGQRDPDSGGFIGFLSPGVLWSPLTDLTVQLAASIPVLNALHGRHREGILFSSSVVVDL